MSSASASSKLQAAIFELNVDHFSIYLEYAAAALLVYEYAITLSAETKHIWRPRKTLVFYLFICLRYSAVLVVLLTVFTDFLPIETSKGCEIVITFTYVLDIISKFCTHGIFILRAFALWNRNVAVLITLTAITAGRFVTVFYSDFSSPDVVATDVSRRFSVCNSTSGRYDRQFSEANAIIVLVFDTLVLALTLAKTVQQVVNFRRLNLGRGISYYIFRDGILYFLVIEILIVADIAVTNLPVVLEFAIIVSQLRLVVTIIMTQRLVLNLRQVDHALHSSGLPPANIGELSFAHGSIIGNIGAPLRNSTDEDRPMDGMKTENMVPTTEKPATPGSQTGSSGMSIDEVAREV